MKNLIFPIHKSYSVIYKLFVINTFLLLVINVQAQQAWQNKTLPVDERVEDLINRLTLEEKVDLMMNSSKAIERFGIKKYDWWNEALHGVARNGTATVFPQTIGMAASFDDSLVYEVFTAVSDEARVKNRIARENNNYDRYTGLTMWTPNINIFRDPRWGRGQETYGEDPYLTTVMGVNVINGLQGTSIDGIDKLHACAKHYAVHSGPEWNRHYFNAENISNRDLWETYLPAFKAAVEKAKVKEVMCAYNRFEGEPCCGSNRLLTQILRDDWHYEGLVVSDCGAISNFYREGAHMTHPNQESAAAAAILSGTDLNCGSTYEAVEKAFDEGLITEEQINISLRRILKARFELGELDCISPWDNLPDSLVNGKAHQDIALQMAHESIVLLQNNKILPLNKNQKIALLGPNADNAEMQWGNYNGIPKHTTTLYEALKKIVPENKIFYEKCSSHTGDTESMINECNYYGATGINALYWNNVEMQGGQAAKIFFDKAVKIGKRDTLSKNLNLFGISAIYSTVLKPKKSGEIELVFSSENKVELSINNNTVELTKHKMGIQLAKMTVKAGASYTIEFKLFQEKQGNFNFDIIRRIPVKTDRILDITKNADIIIYAGGICADLEKEEANVYAPGFEGGDRSDIELPLVQRDLIAALKKAGKKVILVNYSGSAMGLSPETENCEAIIQAWYPGEAGGTAVADILYGKYNPAGRLPVTFYKNVSQLPDFTDYNMKGRTYRYMKEKPLFPFGFGLSYSFFKYTDVKLSNNKIKKGNSVTLNVSVKNTGKSDGNEVVQVYLKNVNDPNGPVKTLRAFKRVTISSGKTANVKFVLTPENLQWWNESEGRMMVCKGTYELFVGGSSLDEDLQKVDFVIE